MKVLQRFRPKKQKKSEQTIICSLSIKNYNVIRKFNLHNLGTLWPSTYVSLWKETLASEKTNDEKKFTANVEPTYSFTLNAMENKNKKKHTQTHHR